MPNYNDKNEMKRAQHDIDIVSFENSFEDNNVIDTVIILLRATKKIVIWSKKNQIS